MITGPDATPVQICDGQLADRHEWLADDTDMFVLLHFYTTHWLHMFYWLHMFSQAVTLLPTCKVTVVKVLSSGKQLRKLGDLQIQMVDVISECTLCVAACYGLLGSTDMMSLRFTVWLSKMSIPKLNSAPELKDLPPKIEAFEEYVYRAHLTDSYMKSCS